MKKKKIFSDMLTYAILNCYRKGFTDKQVADFLGIPPQTLRDRLKYNDLIGQVREIKEKANEAVEGVIFAGCFPAVTTKIEYRYIQDENGKRKKVKYREKIEEIQPNETCLKLYAVNRMNWKLNSTPYEEERDDRKEPLRIYERLATEDDKGYNDEKED